MFDSTPNNMFDFSNHLLWFQKKIGTYDQQNWETSVEQRILHGLENRPKKEGSLNKALIDIDLVRGSTFSKAKPRHGLKYVIINGLKRIILFPYYYSHWKEHFTKELLYVCLLHYIIQVTQLIIYFCYSNSSEIMAEEVMLPFVLALCLGILHAHIIAPCTTKRNRKKVVNSTSSLSNAVSPSSLNTGTKLETLGGYGSATVPIAINDVAVASPINSLDQDISLVGRKRRSSNNITNKQLTLIQQQSPCNADNPQDDTGSELSDIVGSPDTFPENRPASIDKQRDEDTETKDSSSDEERNDKNNDTTLAANSNELQTVTMINPNISKRVKICEIPNTNLRNLIVAPVGELKESVPDQDDLQKFISAKNKQIPDPTPITNKLSTVKKDSIVGTTTMSKKMSLPGPVSSNIILGGCSGNKNYKSSVKHHRNRVATNSCSLQNPGENLSEITRKLHKYTETEDITCPTDTNQTDDKLNDVPTFNSQISYDKAVENWIFNNSTMLSNNKSLVMINGSYDEYNPSAVVTTSTSNAQTSSGTTLINNNTTPINPITITQFANSDPINVAGTEFVTATDKDVNLYMVDHSSSQPNTPFNHSSIAGSTAGSRLKHKIEIRKVSSANGSPGTHRKETLIADIPPNIMTETITPSLEDANNIVDSCSTNTENTDSQLQQQLNILLNEDTITKSHRKRDEFKALFESRAAENNKKTKHYPLHRTSIAKSNSSDRKSSSPSTSSEQRNHEHKAGKSTNDVIPGVIVGNSSGNCLKRRQQQQQQRSQRYKENPKDILSMSETEYDRMNSDVNSTGASTSDGEEIIPLKDKDHSNEHELAGDQLEQSVHGGQISIEVNKHGSIAGSKSCSLPGRHQSQSAAGGTSKINNLNDSNKSPTGNTAAGYLGDGSRLIHRENSGDNDKGDRDICRSQNQQQQQEEDPFVLWYKEAHAPIPMHGVNDSVSCYVWEKEELKKTNLSLLDIGWSIIQAVERYNALNNYSHLGMIVTCFLCFTPMIFRGYFNWPIICKAVHPLSNDFVVTYTSFNASVIFHKSLLSITNIAQTVATALLGSSWPVRITVFSGVILRFLLYIFTFLLLCVAENSFEQRLQYAKHFCRLTSSRRARKYYLPHFRLNKLANIKCWLSLRSYLKKRGPQRSVESIISGAFYVLLAMLSLVCVNLLQSTDGIFFKKLINWDLMLCSVALGIFMLRFLVLGTKITKKYQNRSVIITEQINLFLAMQTRPHKKDDLNLAHNVLRLAENLLKEVEGPFRVCGWSMNPLLYNVLKVVILSVFSTVLSDAMGFKMKLYKIKLNPANW